MYFLVDERGSSLFLEPKPYEFCISCLFTLLNRDDLLYSKLRLLSVPALRLVQSGLLSLSACERLFISTDF